MSHAPEPVPSSARSRMVTGLCIVLVIALFGFLLLYPRPRTVVAPETVQVTSTVDENRLYETFIRNPAGSPSVKTGLLDPHGQPISVACNTCHATRPPNAELRVGGNLAIFHQGLKGNHGNLTCVSCHDSNEGYQTLRLADGKSLPFTEVMQLCAQCHGPQFRDYSHGAHGGMTGYWDLTQGPRQRNNCIDCHDPHSPKYPTVRPARGPQDRFQSSPPNQKGAGHE